MKMPMSPVSKTRQLVNYLYNTGNAISESQIRAQFGIKHPKRVMSIISSLVEKYGNWEIVTTENSGRLNGATTYQMLDTHPGDRTFQFDRNGKRFVPQGNAKRLTTVC